MVSRRGALLRRAADRGGRDVGAGWRSGDGRLLR